MHYKPRERNGQEEKGQGKSDQPQSGAIEAPKTDCDEKEHQRKDRAGEVILFATDKS